MQTSDTFIKMTIFIVTFAQQIINKKVNKLHLPPPMNKLNGQT